MVIPGLLVVFLCVFGGYMWSGGKMGVLLSAPAEFVTILGAALGGTIISTPKKLMGALIGNIKLALKGGDISKQMYMDLLSVLYQLFSLSRKQGLLALEAHVSDPNTSDIFSKYPSILHNHHAMNFLNEALRLVIDGSVQPDELELLMDSTIETHHAEAHAPVNVIQKVGDALPGLGIVGAVLGIIITMGYIDREPKFIGMKVSHALFGTFLGVFVAYGMINPMVTTLEQLHSEEEKFLEVMKTALGAFVGGATPGTAVEYARRVIFSYDRPTAEEVETACKATGG